MLARLRSYRPGGRVAVRLVVVVALVSIATGVVAILTDPVSEAAGALGDVQAAAEFSGTVVGFALLVAAWGMRRGYRIASVAAAALVCLAAVHGVVQFRLASIPLVVLSLGGLAVLVLTSDRFTRSSALGPTQLGALVAIVGVCCYGTAGAYTLRAQFDELHTVADAVYFTLVTASTVGYGDIHPTTATARLFAVSLVVLGPTTVGVAVGSLFGPAIETRLSRTGRRATAYRSRDRSRDGARVVVLGVDERTARFVDRLAERARVTVVTSDERGAKRLLEGVETVETVDGDPTETRVLERARLEACDAVLVTATGDIDPAAASSAARAVTDARLVLLGGPDAAADLGADAIVDPEAVVVDAIVRATRGEADQSSSAASHSG
ncbi:ion channel [Natronococcus occultus]|uniref:K+ transport system, NAD-binding component n=1 Tax=Natronococcus occultus SP4 TaxID=694430 RepID=L0K1S6_9EURY|nr:ion channel [Natronococcus occultus]AGB38505.1 K+ transport system, NAD-binding component [Natronococcus occultus SP4]